MTGSFLSRRGRAYLAGTKWVIYATNSSTKGGGCQRENGRRKREDKKRFRALYCGVVEGLTIRKATPGDTNRIADLLGGAPGQEAVGLAGDAEKAREFGMAMVRLPNSPQGWQRTAVAETQGRVVGIAQAGPEVPGMRITPRLTYLAQSTSSVQLAFCGFCPGCGPGGACS